MEQKPQTILELCKELGYSERHMRDIAKEQVSKGEWEEVLIPDPQNLVKAYVRRQDKKRRL